MSAKIDLKFLDCEYDNNYLQAKKQDLTIKNEGIISINGSFQSINFSITLDKPTAIKFAKTLRTEINKIK